MIDVVILAAGQGTRMRSAVPKVLHPIGGRPMLEHVVLAARAVPGVDRVHVVYGHGGDQVRAALSGYDVVWVLQDRQLGTGHAVAQAMPGVADAQRVLVLYGDVPLINSVTLGRLLAAAAGGVGLLTATLNSPTGYGRIVRDARGAVQRIVEQKDASEAERAITEINTGIMVAPAARLRAWLAGLKTGNAQGEYYLTDIIAMAVQEGCPVHTAQPERLSEVQGVNDKRQLAELERDYQRANAERLMLAGVSLRDPARFDLRGELQHGQDVVIDVNVILQGRVVLGDRVSIGAGVVIKDCVIGNDTEILPFTVMEHAVVGANCHVGPYARVRPETTLADGARVGNFVELKKAEIGSGSKINHLSYVGDATIGADVNIGAGTITCNYDGANKHQTIIEDNVFVGSDTQLVAPVRIGAGATIAAGSTITKEVQPGDLALSRVPQVTRKGWKRPVKKPKH